MVCLRKRRVSNPRLVHRELFSNMQRVTRSRDTQGLWHCVENFRNMGALFGQPTSMNSSTCQPSILRLQSSLIFVNERANLVGHAQKLQPLLLI
jgi:hypothetical protein